MVNDGWLTVFDAGATATAAAPPSTASRVKLCQSNGSGSLSRAASRVHQRAGAEVKGREGHGV